MFYTLRKPFNLSWMCCQMYNPLKKDKEPFLKIKEIKNNIIIDNNGKENKPRSFLWFFFSQNNQALLRNPTICVFIV